MRFHTLFAAVLAFLLVPTLAPPTAHADSFKVTGVVDDGYSGPATDTEVTLCEFDGSSTGYSQTVKVPENGVVEVVFPFLPVAVAFEVSANPTFHDVHILVARPICPVSPCNPDQSGAFVVRLARRPKVPVPVERFRPIAAPLAP